MNVQQVYQLLLNNGANQSEAATLAGISVWEAGGGNPNAINSQALNPNPPDYSVGLFQYNFYYPSGFNASNPMSSTRNGYSAGQLFNDVNAQAQSAIALLRGTGHNYATQWSTFLPHFSSIQGYVNQLLGTSQPSTETPTVTDTTTAPVTTTTTPTDTGTQTTATMGPSPQISPTSSLNLADSIQHTIIQFLLVIIGIAMLLGGIYLLGSKR